MSTERLRPSILIVDDDPLVLEALRQTFMDEYEVLVAPGGDDALKCLAAHRAVAAIVLDIRMARMDGFLTAQRIRQIPLDTPIVFHTGYAGDYSAEQIAAGQPFDYVGKHEDPGVLITAVRKAVRHTQFKQDSASLIEHARDAHGLVGNSRQMLEVYRIIEQVAPTDVRVMVLGATGTGKELVARAIHECSRRVGHRWQTYNCSYKNRDLVEDDLFGHVRGAYTHALSSREGIFEYANGGTVFLDEIGDLDLDTQVKLLRVVESGELNVLGDPATRRVNVRIICATNADLAQRVEQGRFREDLYYRLKGISIQLPALCDRRQDIPQLIDYFMERCCVEQAIQCKYFEQAARDLLIEYQWPGHVRELLRAVESLVSSTPSYFISKREVEDYLSFKGHDTNGKTAYREIVMDYKRIVLIQGLDRTKGNVRKLADELDLDPANLHKLLSKLGIH